MAGADRFHAGRPDAIMSLKGGLRDMKKKRELENLAGSLETIEWYEGLTEEERNAISDEKAREVVDAYGDFIKLEVVMGSRQGCLIEFEENGLTAGRLISQEERDYIDRTGKLPFEVPEGARWRFNGEEEWHDANG